MAATGTLMPAAVFTGWDSNGDPLVGGKLYTYAAGTSTPLATYSDVGLTTPNANPIILDAAGRATVFLTAASYKFVLKTSADVTEWTQDNVGATPGTNVSLDVTGTAGEALAAGDVVYLSAGDGGLTAGRWYKADADNTYSSSAALYVGMAPDAVASGAAGSFRIQGRVTGLSGLSVGTRYYVSATAGALTSSAPANSRFIGAADSTTTILIAPNPVGGLSPGSNYINDTANANMTTGLTINQGAADNEVVALKSSDIAHGATTITETDTFGTLQKNSASGGGMLLTGLSSSGASGIGLRAIQETADSTRATTATGALYLQGYLRVGTGVGSLGANTNIAVFADQATVRFILDSDGDSHQDVGTSWTNFDTHDDVQVLNLLTAYVTRPDDPLRETFGQWLLQSRETLERLRLVTFNDDGHHFVNMSRLTMLLVGAMRQIGSRMERLEQRLLAVEA